MTTSVKRRVARRIVGSLIGLAVITVGIFAVVRLGFDHETAATEPAASARSSEARDSLCEAAASVRRGDPAGARSIFFGRTHDRLHQLAADTGERSRAAAARLLEAKAKVEAGFDPPAASLAEDLEVVAVATGQAMAAAGAFDPGRCPR